MLATGVVALVIGVFTATAEGSVGPHEADLAITSTHSVDIDLGPLGALLLESPAPWPLGVQVDVGEIPATLTEVDNPLDAKAVVTKIGESLMAEVIITDTKSSNLGQGAPSMLKSQILAGGRGKGEFDTDGKGGVRMVST